MNTMEQLIIRYVQGGAYSLELDNYCNISRMENLYLRMAMDHGNLDGVIYMNNYCNQVMKYIGTNINPI